MIPELDIEKARKVVENALEEDVGRGDITTNKIVSQDTESTGCVIARQGGVVAGLPLVDLIYEGLEVKRKVNEGDMIEANEEIIEINGRASSMLIGERVALNFLCHLSGIATLTRKFVDKVKDYEVAILDTRKTLPGLRALEKYAVTVGGGENHRFGLYDRVLVKDNHLKILQRFGPDFIYRAVKKFPAEKVEIEVQSKEEAEAAVEAGADILLMDNMSIEDMREITDQFKNRVLLEASGGVTLDNVVEIARIGVEYISIGSLTLSAPALDMSFEVR